MEDSSTDFTLKALYDLEMRQISIKEMLFPPALSITELRNNQSFWEGIQCESGFNATEMSRVYLNVCSKDLKDNDGLNPYEWLEFPFVKRLLSSKSGKNIELNGHSLEFVQDQEDQVWMSPDLFRLFAGWLDPTFSNAVEDFRFTKTWLTLNIVSNNLPRQKRYVYLIGSKCKQVMKIGISSNVDNRLKSLQSSNALNLDLLFWVEGDSSLESSLLAKFSHLKIRGEWLSWDKTIASHFRILKKNQGVDHG